MNRLIRCGALSSPGSHRPISRAAAVALSTIVLVGAASPTTAASRAPAPVPWSHLHLGVPLQAIFDEGLPIAARVGHSRELAYCARGAIQVSTNGGRV